MKRLPYLALSLFLGSVFVACEEKIELQESTPVEGEEVSVYFIYNLPTDNGGSMTKLSNAEVFEEFYEKIVSAELVAEEYDLQLTETTTGSKYEFKGKWNSHDMVTVRTGKYHITGVSTALGKSIQDKCSFTFDETVEISTSSSAINLTANYDCFLLIFSANEIATLSNYNGEESQSFYSFKTYKYAFVNGTLFKEGKQDKAYIGGTYTDNAEFKCYTGNLAFEKGKYYVYSSVTGGFTVPPMEEGSAEGNDKAVTIVVPPDNEIWYTSNTGNLINLSNYPYELKSNTYENGIGKYKFAKAVTTIGNYFGSNGNSESQIALFSSLILPANITSLSSYQAFSKQTYLATLVFPEKLSSMGSDLFNLLGNKLESGTETHFYFLTEQCPQLSTTTFWNLYGSVFIHYPTGADYSAMESAVNRWLEEDKKDGVVRFFPQMIETTYHIEHAE